VILNADWSRYAPSALLDRRKPGSNKNETVEALPFIHPARDGMPASFFIGMRYNPIQPCGHRPGNRFRARAGKTRIAPRGRRDQMPKILVVDDAEFLRVRTARLLAVEGFAVVEADNGTKAVELFRSEKPDITLLDISMPEKDGLTALKEILADQSDAKVVMLSSQGQETLVLQAIRAGAKDYIVKPVEKDRVLGVIHKILGITL
jgi:two-component system chemotaxis response regulator CheY